MKGETGGGHHGLLGGKRKVTKKVPPPGDKHITLGAPAPPAGIPDAPQVCRVDSATARAGTTGPGEGRGCKTSPVPLLQKLTQSRKVQGLPAAWYSAWRVPTCHPLAVPALCSAPLRNATPQAHGKPLPGQQRSVCPGGLLPGMVGTERQGGQLPRGSGKLETHPSGPGVAPWQAVTRSYGGSGPPCAGAGRIRMELRGWTERRDGKSLRGRAPRKGHQRGGDLGKRKHTQRAVPQRGAATAATAGMPELR